MNELPVSYSPRNFKIYSAKTIAQPSVIWAFTRMRSSYISHGGTLACSNYPTLFVVSLTLRFVVYFTLLYIFGYSPAASLLPHQGSFLTVYELYPLAGPSLTYLLT